MENDRYATLTPEEAWDLDVREAAEAMRGQPVTFHEWDIEGLRDAALFLRGTLSDPTRIHGTTGNLYQIAVRIRALLPPE